MKYKGLVYGLMLSALCLVLISCQIPNMGQPPVECSHIDGDNSGTCDKCGEPYTAPDSKPICQHRDKNDDYFCDACGELFQDGDEVGGGTVSCAHRDANDDGKCDKCATSYFDEVDIFDDAECTHRDADDNGLCDLCGIVYSDGEDSDHEQQCTHNRYTISETNIEASCETEGKYEKIWHCTDCGEDFYSRSATTPPQGHTDAVGICKRCGELDGGITIDPSAPYTRFKNYLGDFIFFGEYPQMLKKDDVTISDTVDARGYYLGSDGCYYAKKTAAMSADGSNFYNGTQIEGGKDYYFKVQPIRWRVVSEANGRAYLACDSILYAGIYQNDIQYQSGGFYFTDDLDAPADKWANEYAYSDARKWLNTSFYDIAFSAAEKQRIPRVSLSTPSPSNASYHYATVEDAVFLPTIEDACASGTGFVHQNTIGMIASDFCRMTGIPILNQWWTRTPSNHAGIYGKEAYIVSEFESVNSTAQVDGGPFGFVPTIYITL